MCGLARSVPYRTRFTFSVMLVVRLCAVWPAPSLTGRALLLCDAGGETVRFRGRMVPLGLAVLLLVLQRWHGILLLCDASDETVCFRGRMVPLGLAGGVGLLCLILNFTKVGIVMLILNLEVRWL
ncbi:hypothetical protein BK127_03790 [Paenibacillus sp. FSL H7-0331]|nr:hypothetical protein BK127_03790 [Paenibacillus sp. FSL H7-0331]